MTRAVLAFVCLLAGCTAPTSCEEATEHLVWIGAETYRLGSSSEEREIGYRLSPSVIRDQRWYDAWELPVRDVVVDGVWIDRTPVTQRDYAEFVARGEARAPDISREDYRTQGFLVHPYETVERYRWAGERPPRELADHPVTLVSWRDASDYCSWRGGRLPTEDEWEAACRGTTSRIFPWGDQWISEAAHVESGGTASVHSHTAGATPEGVLDLAGNVFEWTSSTFSAGRITLRGCSWDDAPGTCRCSFRHGRPPGSRHVLIGFRCATRRLPRP